ncbi:MAG TPA: MmcQ/YjbR family DNA-binding protein [Rhizomicrobium sp.]
MKSAAKKPSARPGVSAGELKRIALSFPGVEEGTSYGAPSFLLAKKFFTRLRGEDNSIVLIVGSIDERDMLLESDPALFHITAHYRNYPAVLLRLERLDPAVLRAMLERRWRAIAPKKLLNAGTAPAKATTAKKR